MMLGQNHHFRFRAGFERGRTGFVSAARDSGAGRLFPVENTKLKTIIIIIMIIITKTNQF